MESTIVLIEFNDAFYTIKINDKCSVHKLCTTLYVYYKKGQYELKRRFYDNDDKDNILNHINKLCKKNLYIFLYKLFIFNVHEYNYNNDLTQLCNELFKDYNKKISKKRFIYYCNHKKIKYKETYFYFKLFTSILFNNLLDRDVSIIIQKYI
jgi:hypothetical protein